MLYTVAHDYLVHAVENSLIQRGYHSGLGQVLVDLHLDERFYVMPVSVDVAAQEQLLRAAAQDVALLERLADAVCFEDLTTFGGVLRVFARTLLNRAGVSDIVRGQAPQDGARRHHIVPRVARVLEAIADVSHYGSLTNFDTLLALIEHAATEYLNANGPQGFLSDDLSTIQALRGFGVESTRENVRTIAQACGLQGWVKWTRGLYSGVRYLDKVCGLDPERFRTMVREAIDGGSNGPLELGQLFEDSVQEMGLALAMSFFGDLGNKDFAKPDRHVVGALEKYEGVKPNPKQAFQRLQRHSLEAGIAPRRLDKLFYLAGSGNFYLTGFDFRSHFKAGFLEHLKFAGMDAHADLTQRRGSEDNTFGMTRWRT